jgi:amphi-Trp domain-containing protein
MKKKVKASGTVEYQRAISYLEEMLEKMRSGDLVMSSGENSVAFHAHEAVELEIEAKEKDGKQEFSFEMVWKEGLTPGEMGDFSFSGERLFAGGGESSETELEQREFGSSFQQEHSAGKREKSAGKRASGECSGVSGSVEYPADCAEL